MSDDRESADTLAEEMVDLRLQMEQVEDCTVYLD